VVVDVIWVCVRANVSFDVPTVYPATLLSKMAIITKMTASEFFIWESFLPISDRTLTVPSYLSLGSGKPVLKFRTSYLSG
jgi:hypothetical protein